MDGSSPITTTTPRPLTIQEKVQRKRARNKTPTFNTGSSPRRDQIKQQLVKAMASPTHSIENNRPVSSQQQSRYTDSEEGNGGYNDSTTNMESPLASTENKQVIQSFGMMSHYGSAEEQRENSSQNNVRVKPKAPTRRKLPKWPPDPVNIEKSDDPVNQEPMEQTISQPAKDEREMAKPEQPTVSKGKAPWARNVQTSTSSNAKNTVNSGKPSWVRPVAKEEETGGSQAQSNDTITPTGSTSSPKRGPSWARSRTPSPVPSNASSQQTPSWVRPSTVASNIYSQQKASWVRPSAKEQTPSPAPSTADSTTSQQTPLWVRPQRAASPVPNNASDAAASQPQKAPWARPQRTPSPVPSIASDNTSRQKAPWVRPSSTEQANSVATNGYSQKKAPWVKSSPTTEQTPSSPVSQREQEESENAPETRANASSPKKESFVQRRMRSMRLKEMERQASESSLSVDGRDVVNQKNGIYSPRRKSPTKKWPPVCAQPFPNSYRQQYAVEQTVKSESPLPNSPKVEEQPDDTLSSEPIGRGASSMTDTDNQASVTPTANNEAKKSAVRKAPWLRTSPPASTSDDSRTSRRDPPPKKQADPATSLERQTQSPVPTDEGNHQSSWAQSASRIRPSPNDNGRSIAQRPVPRPFQKPPPSQLSVNNTTKYVPPWVKEREAEAELNSNAPESDPSPIEDNLDTTPSDEVNMAPPPPVSSDRNQPTTSPSSPGRNKILNEVKTRQVSMNGENWRERQGSDGIAEVVVSYGGSVIETPKSVNVASLGASFASGERFSSPPKSTSLSKISYGASPLLTNRHFSKQSTSPRDSNPDQPERPPWTAGAHSHVSTEEPKRNGPGQWNKVHSPPPSWSRGAHSSKPQGSQRDLGTIQSTKYAPKPPIGRTAPAQTPPPSWIKQDVSKGDLSSIKSPRCWGQPKISQSPQGSAPVDRSQPPSWVNRDVSQGDMSSIKSHDWSYRPSPVKESIGSSHPPSWVDGDAVQDVLSPIASPEPASLQRKVRITVETVDDESDGVEVVDRPWSPESQTTEYVYATGEGAASGSNCAAEESASRSRGDYADEDVDADEEDDGQYPEKSPTISLAQMAMDSVFAIDFDLVMAQARKPVLLEDDEESSASSPSKGIAKSTPPERELPDEVKAMLERSLNRSTRSESGIHEDSAAYEADYFSTDMSNNAMDKTGSTWNENDISALSDDSGLEPLSPPPTNDTKSLEPSLKTNRALHFSTGESPVKAEESNKMSDEILERIRATKLNDDDLEVNKTDDGSSSSAGLEHRDLYGRTNSAKERSPRITERVVDGWCGGRVPSPRRQEEPSSKTRGVASFTNFGPNESTIDLGNPTDFSIQVSPDSPRQTSLVGTSPALVSDSPPEDFAVNRSVKFDGPGERDDTRNSVVNEPLPSVSSVRQLMEEWQNEKEAIEESLPPPPPMDDGTSPPSSAGAIEVLKYFKKETQAEVGASGINDSDQWCQQDSALGDMTPQRPVQTETISGAKWHKRNGITASIGKSTKSSSIAFGGQDPFSKQDAQDPFFGQDDPFAASKSASSDFAYDFGGFNPFADDPETNEAFDFERETQQEFFSPYGDAPKSTTTTRSRTSTPTRLTPSRRDLRRRAVPTEQYLVDDDFYISTSTQQPSQVTTTTTRYEPGPPPPEEEEFVEYYAQHASYVPTEDGTYLLEI